MTVAVKNKREQKRVTITSKRQFTIPQKFYTELGFDKEADCIMGDGMLILRPAAPSLDDEFAEQILSDLIDEGYAGSALLDEFKSRRAKIRPSIEALLRAAKNAADGVGEYASYDDVFGTED